LHVRAAVFLAILLFGVLPPVSTGAQNVDPPATGAVLAPVGRQAGWISLLAPRPQVVTHVEAPDYVSDVAILPGSTRAAIVVVRSPTGTGVPYGEIMTLDVTSGAVAPLVGGLDSTESLGAPVWSSDGARLLYQREDVSVIGTSYAGGATVQYPSRIEQVNADGSERAVVVDDARQPAASADNQLVAYVRRTREGPSLMVRGLAGGSERVVIGTAQFGDIVSPRYAPQGDRIAFMAPVMAPVTGGLPLEGVWFAPLRLAHGAPWDLWIVNADGSAPPFRLAAVGADDGTVAWSPDGTRLFVYGGTGSFIVDAGTGDVTALGFLSGYGATSWVLD
jgi:Tol biopolymer transport system component